MRKAILIFFSFYFFLFFFILLVQTQILIHYQGVRWRWITCLCVSQVSFLISYKFRFVYDFAPFPDELPLSQNRKQKHVKRDNFSDTFFNESTNSILGTFFIDATGRHRFASNSCHPKISNCLRITAQSAEIRVQFTSVLS